MKDTLRENTLVEYDRARDECKRWIGFLEDATTQMKKQLDDEDAVMNELGETQGLANRADAKFAIVATLRILLRSEIKDGN